MNLIFSSFHYNPEANKSHSVKLETYLENIVVALISAKRNNPDDSVELIVTENTLPLLPEYFVSLLKANNVGIRTMPFTYFKNDEGQIWSFSFYRLSIMLELSKDKIYENIVSIDSDTFTTKSYKFLYDDCKNYILLLDLNHSHEIIQAQDTAKDYLALRNKEIYFINYGGEFIAGSSEKLFAFMSECLNVFNELNEKQIKFTHGDETVLAISAFETNLKIKNAGPYVYRFWTGRAKRIISTVYEYNPVCVFHVPDEKITGLRFIYDYFRKKNIFPDSIKAAKMLGIFTKKHVRIKEIYILAKRKLKK